MTRKKQTLYEILEITANASCQDILAAHQRLLEKLLSAQGDLGLEEFDYRRKLLKLALDTLSDPVLRRDYDEKLMSRPPSVHAEQSPPAVARHAHADSLASRADALSLRAEALALRADAMSIKTDVSLLGGDLPAPSLASRVGEGLGSSVRIVIVIIGTLAAIAMLSQAVFVFFAVRKTDGVAAAAARAEEQVIIQEYYQKYGVRPANATEARLLERENQRQESEARAAEREKQRTEYEASQFEAESRRIGEQVSADLRYAEERMKREEAEKKAQQEEELGRKAAAEAERLEKERDKWREVLSR